MGFSTRARLSVVLWALNGWFQGFGAPAGVVALAQWFSNRERGRFYGIWSTAHSIGEGTDLRRRRRAGRRVRLALRDSGRRACCASLVAVGIYLLMQDRPRTLGLPTVARLDATITSDGSGRAATGDAVCCSSSSRS